MNPRRLIADVLLDVADLAERAAKALREEPEPDDLRRRVAELEQRQDLLREWARTEGDTRALSLEALAGGPPSDFDRTILAARKAGGQ